MKEQDKTSEEQLSEVEMVSLPENEVNLPEKEVNLPEKGGHGMIYLKWWKAKTYSLREYSTQQGSHSDSVEKSKALQTSKG